MPLPTLLVPGSLSVSGSALPDVPVAWITAWIKKRMPEYGKKGATIADRVLVVRAETGSGKSTVLPVELFRLLRSKDTPARMQYRGPSVACTQPRVLTAISLANGVSVEKSAWNPDMRLGETVGFQTGPVSNSPMRGLIYMTSGVLAAQLANEDDARLMDRYRFIVFDEAHERSLQADLVLMLLRDFYERNAGNERLPFLLLASATFDTARYAAYFGLGPANVAEVAGRAYTITTHWPAAGTNNYPAEAAAVAVRIHEQQADDPPERADILIFMPGGGEMAPVIAALNAWLKGAAAEDKPPFLVLAINRDVVNAQTGDYPLVFAPPARLPRVNGRAPQRRVVVSTVVAETGLTIDTLRYVVDCGWSRTREVYQPWGVVGLTTRPAPKSRILQRKGRAGRLFPGDFYPLYTEGTYKALDDQQLPEIIAGDAAEVYLQVVLSQQRQRLRAGRPPEFRVEGLTLLDAPSVESLLAANAAATALGFVSAAAPLPDRWPPAAPGPGAARGYGLTPLGFIAAAFSRTPMEGVRVLLAGAMRGVAASDLATAVAMFGTPLGDLFERAALRKKKGGPTETLPPGAEALREALPPYLVQRLGGGVLGGAAGTATPPTEGEAFYFRAKLLLADDFVEAILYFDAFARRIDASGGDLGGVAAWCGEVGLSFTAMIDLARKRDGLMEEAIVAGLNPFRESARRLVALPAEEFTDGLTRFKRCLYDGLRGRLLRLDPKDGRYYTRQGLRVKAPPVLADAMASRLRALGVTRGSLDTWRPRWVLTDQVKLSPAPKREEDAAAPLLSVVEANLVSVLDGYVDPDPEYDEPRTF